MRNTDHDDDSLDHEECIRCASLRAACRLRPTLTGPLAGDVTGIAEALARWIAADEIASPLRRAAVEIAAKEALMGTDTVGRFVERCEKFAEFLGKPTIVEPAPVPPRKLRRAPETPEAV